MRPKTRSAVARWQRGDGRDNAIKPKGDFGNRSAHLEVDVAGGGKFRLPDELLKNLGCATGAFAWAGIGVFAELAIRFVPAMGCGHRWIEWTGRVGFVTER
jgi:hypothetical protein